MHKILLKNNEIFDTIVNCYQSDSELVSKFHVTPGNLSDCVDRTVSDLLNNDVKVYKIQNKDQFIGYFGDTDNKYLNGFFVMPNMRKQFNDDVWKLIASHFNNKFQTAVFGNNERAITFLKKQGCQIVETITTSDGIGYIFNYEDEQCH